MWTNLHSTAQDTPSRGRQSYYHLSCTLFTLYKFLTLYTLYIIFTQHMLRAFQSDWFYFYKINKISARHILHLDLNIKFNIKLLNKVVFLLEAPVTWAPWQDRWSSLLLLGSETFGQMIGSGNKFRVLFSKYEMIFRYIKNTLTHTRKMQLIIRFYLINIELWEWM